MGDPDKLRIAARAFTNARDILDALTAALYQALYGMFAHNDSEDLRALDEFWQRVAGRADTAILTALRDTCDALSRALDEFANWIVDTSNQINRALEDTLKSMAAGALLALLLAALTEGISALLGAAEAGVDAGALVVAIDGVVTASGVTARAAAVGATAGGVIGLMQVAIKNTPSPNLNPTDPQVVTDSQITTEAETTAERAARAEDLPELKYPEKQLQKKFKHADEFGVEGNWNQTAANEYEQALEDFAKDPGNTLKSGTYHGEPAILIYNESSGLCEVLYPDGTYWTGFRLGAEQLRNVIERGTLGGGG